MTIIGLREAPRQPCEGDASTVGASTNVGSGILPNDPTGQSRFVPIHVGAWPTKGLTEAIRDGGDAEGIEHLLRVMVQGLGVPREGEPKAVSVPTIVEAMGLTAGAGRNKKVRGLIDAALVAIGLPAPGGLEPWRGPTTAHVPAARR